MEKESLRLNPRKFWRLLHDHFVEHYYNTTKNQPPDYLIHYPVIVIRYLSPTTTQQIGYILRNPWKIVSLAGPYCQRHYRQQF
jgi:hypothetical protein